VGVARFALLAAFALSDLLEVLLLLKFATPWTLVMV